MEKIGLMPHPWKPNRQVFRIICCCEELLCEGFTTTCPYCGADYNRNGDRLAPRSQWGEETGERFT